MTLATMTCDVTIDPSPETLGAIVRPETALSIWRRGVSGPLRAMLEALDLDEIDNVSRHIDAKEPLHSALGEAGYPDDIVAPFAGDIALLVQHHAVLTGADRLALRLEIVETDACRRFHADYVTLRMLCTYVGPGTQWCRADRPDAISVMPTGAVAVFKGRLLLDPPAILHRSPPIATTGGRRLMFAIDPA